MDAISNYESESPKTKFIRYGTIGISFIFVIVVAILSIVDGFETSGKEGFIILGIGLLLFMCTTSTFLYRAFRQTVDEGTTKFLAFLQVVLLVYFAIALLLALVLEYHSADVNCYYDNSNQYVSKNWGCYEPPDSCSQPTSSSCWMDVSGVGQVCGSQSYSVENNTYTCVYTTSEPLEDELPAIITDAYDEIIESPTDNNNDNYGVDNKLPIIN